MQDSHPSLYNTKTVIICIFLIHSGRAQKVSTALFKLVWNTQHGQIFLILKSVW